ncbi:hypothetical protein [Rhodococcus sp. 2G]|uniref:hypothetical protein n=1 Tax=Rhodococcus sp. 2G TaxID=1570939 RepID=UPI0012EB7EE8|nr:hypothetical protein [Rhodococcus sp. 2G]
MSDEATIELWPVNIRTGLWCTTCHLPSMVEFDLAMIGNEGVTVIGETSSVCTECPSEGPD